MAHQELHAVILPEGAVQLEWRETAGERLGKNSELLQSQLFNAFTGEPNSDWLLLLGFSDKAVSLSASLSFFRHFAGLFIRKLGLTPDLEQVRQNIEFSLTSDEARDLLDALPPMVGAEYITRDFTHILWQRLHETFSRKIETYEGTVADFIRGYAPEAHLVGRVYFHLVENKKGPDPFAFLATYSSGLNTSGRAKHLPLKHALMEYGDDNEKLLELLVTVHTAAKESELLSDLLESGELFHPLSWSAAEAYAFLREIPLYENSGILCRIPDWWKAGSSSLRLNISLGDRTPSMLGLGALLDFRPRLLLDDVEMSAEEARRLLDEAEGLAFIKNKWVAIDSEKLEQTLLAYDKARSLYYEQGISMMDAMRLQINPQKMLGVEDGGSITGVSHGEWMQSVFERMAHPEVVPAVGTGRDFIAKLRPYQKQGLQWLYHMHGLRFGACLADDMGLGKTVQILAFLNLIHHQAVKKKETLPVSLLIVPASLLSNWVSEIAKFYPRLDYVVAHPEMYEGDSPVKFEPASRKGLHLVITTYALVQRYQWIGEYEWNYVILDEAQAIKNPATKQARAVKKLRSRNRITMTGTPIENRLSDLWSLFDFLNPGLLGNSKEFKEIAKSLAQNPEGYVGLRKVVNPFILRRLKTDKTIISDLPDKVEVKTWASLARKQALLYEQILENIKQLLDDNKQDSIKRKGLILSALMKCKQLCNHPAQYLGSGDYTEKESGKFSRLREICETIYEKRERVLVFTQFKEMTGPLSEFLETIFQRPGLVLHGSVAVSKRKKIVEQFQGKEYVPFLVLSLKAGGVGLNLTAANHVVHFDRWWNPAVENQATDRAFRIGQKKNVMVHKFITKGTIEEKINGMLEEKAKLSDEIIASSGENWITEMNNEELINLFSLTI
ncbi:MAG: DEAD/DEAH box helicase [Desulfobulbaceae bacterium]|nr:DEAD/DEAH box helicase [Desulfobulbaceae bacterium]